MTAPTREGLPLTSYQAADTVDVPRAQRICLVCLILLNGPAVTDQIRDMAIQLGLKVAESTMRARIPGLERAGYVKRLKERGHTDAGSTATLWQLTDEGRKLAKRYKDKVLDEVRN